MLVPMDVGAYLPMLHARWLGGDPAGDWATVDGTLVFADVSGFTPLSERLARQGKAGAEELTDIVNLVGGSLLDVATPLGGDLIKHGGDALLLLFTEDGHEARAAAAAAGMLVAMRRFRGFHTSAGRVTLRMSIGADVGPFVLCLTGRAYRELVITGPAVSRVAALEAAAVPGEVLLGPDLAAALPASSRGAPKDEGVRLRRPPAAEPISPVRKQMPDRILLAGIPIALRDHLGTIRDGEHRQAAVAFLQFLGTDDLLEAEGPAALVAAIHELVTTTEEACIAHGVTFLTTDLDRNAGKILLLCGAPTTAADDEDRLISAVRAILDSDHRLAVRAGVNRGRVFALEVGTETRRVYTVTGDTVNLAARVTGKAPIGACLATSAVLERLATDYDLEPVEPFRVKGKSAPIVGALVGAAIDQRPVGIPVADTPLVGRHAERQLLLDAVADAQAGKLRVIELIGEPGIGKSRLIAELCAHAADTMPIIVVEASQYAATTPYRAVRDAARTMLGVAAYESDELVARQLTDSVRAVAPHLEPWLPLLAVPFGISLPETPETLALAATHRRYRLEESVTAFLGATLPPTGVLVIEDAYWLDEASGELLTHLIRTLQPRLHWVVCAARRGLMTTLDLSGIPGLTKVELSPLPPEDAAAVLAMGSGDLSRAEAKAMVERSGGNPLFLQELAAAAARGSTVEELPDTVEALIAAHIDTLTPADRGLLRTASVLGVNFPKGLLVELASHDTHETSAGARRLRGLLLPSGAGRLRFRHSLLREVAYEGLALKRRRELHSRAADLIRAYAGADTATASATLSLHYFAAGRHLEAWDWSRLAGDRARRSAAPVEAAAFFERALESARHAGIEPAAVAETQEVLGDVCELGGRYERAATAYRHARRLMAGDDVVVGNLLRKQGWVSERAGRYRDALRWYTRGFKAVESVDASAAAGRLKAELYLAYGAVRMRQGRHREAVPLLEEAVRQAEDLDALPTLAHAYYDLDWAWTELGSPDPRYRELALPIYEELDDWQGQGNTLNNLGLGAYYEGRWDEGLRCWQRARDAFEKAGDVVQMATIANNVGEILSDQGHMPVAEEEFRAALATWREAEFRVGLGLATSNLGRAAARAGRFDEAEDLLASALEQLKAIGATELALEAEAREAERLVLSGDHDHALSRAEAVRPLATRPTLVAQVERTIGYAWAQRADVTTARRWLDQSLATAEDVGAAFEIALTRMALVQVNRMAGDPVPPDADAAAILDRLGVVWTPVPPLPGAAAVLGRT